jgi:hypothetical protein
MQFIRLHFKLKMATSNGVHTLLIAYGPASASKTFDKYIYTVIKVADKFTFLATGFDPTPVRVGFMVDKWDLRHFGLRELQVTLVGISPVLVIHNLFIYHRRYIILATGSQ